MSGDSAKIEDLKKQLEPMVQNYFNARNEKLELLSTKKDIYGSPHVAAREASEEAAEFMNGGQMQEI